MINALENWREFALEIKWKRADHNNPFLIRINEACDEIERFFNPKDFDPEIKPDPDNWMLHLLTNKQLSSITFISEIAELLRHLRQIDAYGIYNLIDKNGNVNNAIMKISVRTSYVLHIDAHNLDIIIQYISLNNNDNQYMVHVIWGRNIRLSNIWDIV